MSARLGACILLGADVSPTEKSLAAFLSGEVSRLLSPDLAAIWNDADARIFNLECPLADRETPIEKCGAALRAPTAAAAGIAGLRPTAVALSNNHILDQGAAGLASTAEALRGARIPFFGAGSTAREADGAFTLLLQNKRVAVYAVCEHEYSVAEGERPGANGFDALEIADRLRAIKRDCDYLIVLYHGGREYDPYPSPMLQKRCRKMAEAGANLVLCQHSHCIGSQETYRGCPIVYGQGNFLFDMDDEPCFETGLVVQLLFTDKGVQAEYLPVYRANHGAALAQGALRDEILGGFSARSAEIAVPGFVTERYRAYAAEYREKMLKVFLSGHPALRLLCRLYGRRPTRVYSKAALLAIRNTVACESLNELVEAGLAE